MKKENGITLVALVITIIVLLILAGVTIVTLTGDNGLITKAADSKQASKEAEIKERIILAVNSAKINNNGELKKEALDEELIKEFGENNYELLIVGEGYLIIVDNIEYSMTNAGNVTEGNNIENANIENAGDLSKGGQYDGLTEETAYRVTCIEDLLEWTNNPNVYKNKNIKLENTIDFNSTGSYKDYKAKTTDINGNGRIEDLITELTTGTGFKPINGYSAIFDGQENEIKNIYINVKGNAALFGYMENGSTINLETSGKIISIEGAAGGIVAELNNIKQYSGEDTQNFENCINNCDVQGYSNSGGIIGKITGNVGFGASYVNIKNSSNNGKINSTSSCAGIVGVCGANYLNLNACYNTGIIHSKNGSAYGIGANTMQNGNNVSNCYNTGDINSQNGSASGIVDSANKIINSNNEGNIKGFYASGIVNNSKGDIINCYNAGEINGNAWNASSAGICINFSGKMLNCYNTNKIMHDASWASAGGLIGYSSGGEMENCYNIGSVKIRTGARGTVGGLVGNSDGNIKCKNTYFLNDITEKGIIGKTEDSGIAISNDYVKSIDFKDKLNEYVNDYNLKNENENAKLKIWKYNEGSYPTFE